MNWKNRRVEAALLYRPKTVKLLLVAEAPPNDESRYFYFDDVKEQDSLFRYIVRGVLAEEPTRENKSELLRHLKDRDVFLIDLKEEPVVKGESLAPYVPNLIKRCLEITPAVILLIKATVFDAAYEALKKAGLPVVNERIPFPGSGRQREFELAFARAISAKELFKFVSILLAISILLVACTQTSNDSVSPSNRPDNQPAQRQTQTQAVEQPVVTDAQNTTGSKNPLEDSFTFTDVGWSGSDVPIRLVMELDRHNTLTVTALETREAHNQYFVDNPPTYRRFNGRDYVPVSEFFNDNFKGSLQLDNVTLELTPLNKSQLAIKNHNNIRDLLRSTQKATLIYATGLDGKGQIAKFDISRMAERIESSTDNVADNAKEIVFAGTDARG